MPSADTSRRPRGPIALARGTLRRAGSLVLRAGRRIRRVARRGVRSIRRASRELVRRSRNALAAARAPGRPAQETAASEPIPIPAGHASAEMSESDGLRALILLFGADEDRLAAGVAEVARLQSMLPRFRPLFVSDATDPSVFERHGYASESLVPFQTWIHTHGANGWTSYVEGRMRTILETYQPDRIVVLEAGPEFAALRRGLLNEVLAPAPSPPARPIRPR